VHDRETRHHPDADVTGHDHGHASFAFGILHGLAGSSHLFGVLPALALPTRGAAITYLVSYGLGTVLAMTLFSSVIGLIAAQARSVGEGLYRGLLYGCATLAILVGGFWLLV
jgi:hypothetical protein